ncbi:MAG TPA: hypothetical protein VGH89_05340 [Pseudonocardia sp.]|jgi:hypothetical protein
MSNGFVYWYEEGWSDKAAAVRLTGLDRAGLRLGHPRTGRITALSSEENTAGEQITLDRDSLLREVALVDATTFSFQYWLEGNTDVVCVMDRLADDAVVQRLYLDGLSVVEEEILLAIIVEQITEIERGTFGLVVDHRGESGGVGWDEIVTCGPGDADVLADLIAVRPEVAARHPEFGPIASDCRIGNLVCYGDAAGSPSRAPKR